MLSPTLESQQTEETEPLTSSRRYFLPALAAAATTTTLTGAGEAYAAKWPAPRRYNATPVPTAMERHMLDRFGWGYSPQGLRQLRKAGGPQKWFHKQLTASSVKESKKAKNLPNWYPGLKHSAATKTNNTRNGKRAGWEYQRDLEAYTIMRRVHTNRPVQEAIGDFFAELLYVPIGDDAGWPMMFDYHNLLRKRAFGKFSVLLNAAITHPAMLLYLDNNKSKAGALNENLGRELLELHTVGRSAGYSEAMVKHSARILSGWTASIYENKASYDRSMHETGRVKVLGFEHPNRSADGREVARDYLNYLANHPKTAHRIATRLVSKFVSDKPHKALVKKLARIYLRNNTEMRPVLKALVKSKAFKKSKKKKLRTSHEDLIATLKVLRINAHKPSHVKHFANAVVYAPGGLRFGRWPLPDGPPIDSASHASASRMLDSFRMHWNLTGGYWPKGAVTYRGLRRHIPAQSLRFDRWIDHLSRDLLGRKADRRLLAAACQAADHKPGTIVRRGDRKWSWLTVRVVAVILDSPQHMHR